MVNEGLNENQIMELINLGFTPKEFKAHPVSRDLYKRNLDTNNPDILKEVDSGHYFNNFFIPLIFVLAYLFL